jgi:uncharacterized membrane protein
MSEVVRDPKLSSIVKKLRSGSVEVEIGYMQVLFTVILGIFYAAITALGIDKYNKCEGIKDSEKFQNLKMFMSHTMTIGITVPIVLLLMKFVKNEGGVFTLIYSIMGITASAIAYNIMSQDECKDYVKDTDKQFAIASIIGWIVCLLLGGFLTFKKYPKLGEAFRKKNI